MVQRIGAKTIVEPEIDG